MSPAPPSDWRQRYHVDQRVRVRAYGPCGFDWRPGTVASVGRAYVSVRLDEPVTLPGPLGTFHEWLTSDKRCVRSLPVVLVVTAGAEAEGKR